jgi:hypothetical protein
MAPPIRPESRVRTGRPGGTTPAEGTPIAQLISIDASLDSSQLEKLSSLSRARLLDALMLRHLRALLAGRETALEPAVRADTPTEVQYEAR